MRMAVRSVDVSGLTYQSRRAAASAMFALAENVLADCTPYVAYETWALQASGTAEHSGGTAVVKWGTDAGTARYARAQYYGVGLNHATHGNAARALRGRGWGEMFAHEYRRKL